MAHDPMPAMIAPRPIGWVSTRSADGVRNLAPFSFFNMFNYKPPLIGFCSNGEKDSVLNARETGVFAWNLATRQLAHAMNMSSSVVPRDVDEFELAGLTPAPCRIVDAPRVAESPVCLECRVTQIIKLVDENGGPTISNLVMGQVVGIHIARDLIVDGVYQTTKAVPITRGGGTGTYFEITGDAAFEMPRPA
ncbi:flavin reductase family protein [Sphingomonas profundi]|uniref:flavin reductase family protein n=1 Tax=Alterirhizorhabdus profundi TaxID=2681549 RepID=UPI0012E88FBA